MICMKRNHDHPDPQVRLNVQTLEVKNTHKILETTFDNRLTWKAHITEAKAAKRMNVLRSLAETNWGADQGMLLRIHEMFILSALEYGSGWSQYTRERAKDCAWCFLCMQNNKHTV
jgi:hypothetical protein